MTATQSGYFLKRRPRPRGGVTLELILALPLLVIVLLAVIEVGLILANFKHVAAASREGAKMAAETVGLSPGTTAATAAQVRSAVDRRLEAAGLGASASQGVTVRHTVTAAGAATNGDCSDPVVPALPDATVRVTVCVALTRLSPNLLGAFGFDLAGQTIEHTTTWDYEP